MQQQRTHDGEPQRDPAEHALSMLLTGPEQRPWSRSELELELGDPLAVADGLARLHGLGLVHRLGDFAWATRAALHADRMAG
jgi:hypothetical protein